MLFYWQIPKASFSCFLKIKRQGMSSEEQTIYDFDLDMIYDFFSNTERQGPGSPEITLKALSFINGLTEGSKIADIGC